TVRMRDATTGSEQATLRGHTDRVVSFAFSHDSGMLATGSQSDRGRVKLWDVPTQKLQATFAPAQVVAVPGGTIASIAFAPDGKTLAMGTQFNRVRLWDIASGR